MTESMASKCVCVTALKFVYQPMHKQNPSLVAGITEYSFALML
jgi:hypothetical protein